MIDDQLLPAAVFLTGAAAFDVISPVIAATGARLTRCESVHVQYRPATDLVVRYSADVDRIDGTTETVTLLAATTVNGAPPGTLPVEAVSAGQVMSVGVWKWPFDPSLSALSDAVTPHRAARMFENFLVAPLDIEVVVYRPTERAVIKATDSTGRCAYIKIVTPAAAAPLLERHRRLADAGLPVPAVIEADEAAGWIALAEIEGSTLRELIKRDSPNLPDVGQLVELRQRLTATPAEATVSTRRSRIVDAPAHAEMLGVVMPELQDRLIVLAAKFSTLVPSSLERNGALVHGDLHEAQLIIVDGTIVGLLDVDDAGAGDPVDDIATLLGHLRYRALATATPESASRLHAYIDDLRDAMVADTAGTGIGPETIDAATAAVLVGLATGPFRIQMDGWRDVVHRLLRVVDDLLAPEPGTDEKDLSWAS